MMKAPTETELLEQLREFTLSSIDNRQLDCFIEPQAIIDQEAHPTPLLERLTTALAAPPTEAPLSYLIQGDAGFGKTTLSGQLCRLLWAEQDTWLPLYIHLPQIPDDKLSALIYTYLDKRFTKEQIHTIQQHPLIVFLDGFDELHVTTRQRLQAQSGLFGANQ